MGTVFYYLKFGRVPASVNSGRVGLFTSSPRPEKVGTVGFPLLSLARKTTNFRLRL
jgi:hypothetical protein